MVYSLNDKKVIMTRIQNLKNKKHYIQIYTIIKDVTYDKNDDEDLGNQWINGIEKFINDIIIAKQQN